MIHGPYKYVYSYSAGIDFRRLKSIPAVRVEGGGGINTKEKV